MAEPERRRGCSLSEYLKLLAVYARTLIESDPERSAAADLMGGGRPVKMVAEPLLRRNVEDSLPLILRCEPVSRRACPAVERTRCGSFL